MSALSTTYPIGVFDSGIGGLSVANAIYRLLPKESMVYFADTKRVPYGPRSITEIQQFSEEIVSFLLGKKCKLIVVACNTATAAALEGLRQKWPQIPIIGMEPAVKPAAKATKSNKVGVLATLSTINSERYEQLMQRYASAVEVIENPCIGLVPLIERGAFDLPETKKMLHAILDPMLEQEIDTLVLGCTHYPFLMPLLNEILGDGVKIIDPAPAVARQVKRILVQSQLLAVDSSTPQYRFFASAAHPQLAQYTDIPFNL